MPGHSNCSCQAKKDISGLTMTVDSYNKAFNKFKPALTHEETCNKAGTWALANRIKIEQYDKYMDNRRVGKKIDIKAMGHTLIDAYDYSLKPSSWIRYTCWTKRANPSLTRRPSGPR